MTTASSMLTAPKFRLAEQAQQYLRNDFTEIFLKVWVKTNLVSLLHWIPTNHHQE